MIVFACFAMTAALLYFIFNLPTAVEHPLEKTRLAFLRERKEMVYENLRDLNFEHRAGKLPDADYAQMRAALEEDAAAILAEMEQIERQQLVMSR